jgi:hypothetical protein
MTDDLACCRFTGGEREWIDTESRPSRDNDL